MHDPQVYQLQKLVFFTYIFSTCLDNESSFLIQFQYNVCYMFSIRFKSGDKICLLKAVMLFLFFKQFWCSSLSWIGEFGQVDLMAWHLMKLYSSRLQVTVKRIINRLYLFYSISTSTFLHQLIFEVNINFFFQF